MEKLDENELNQIFGGINQKMKKNGIIIGKVL